MVLDTWGDALVVSALGVGGCGSVGSISGVGSVGVVVSAWGYDFGWCSDGAGQWCMVSGGWWLMVHGCASISRYRISFVIDENLATFAWGNCDCWLRDQYV